jgi:Mce-associated membrane protein
LSSSANRRPRVAGQRRRPLREDGLVDAAPQNPDGPDAVEGADSDPDGAPGPDDGARPDDGTKPDESTKPDATAADDEAQVRDAGAETVAWSLRLPAVALVLCLALLTAVLVVTRSDPEERPRAASAATATARSTLEQILSYNHSTMTQQLPQSQALLTGAFKQEFGETMTKTIVPLAQKDKTVVKARVYEAGVMSQTADTVTVQAFVNQARTSDTQKEPSIDQNRVIATMTKSGNRWLVSSLKAY